MEVILVYKDAETGKEIRHTIDDLYWFEENYVHNLDPQHVNGYGEVRFEIVREGAE